MDATSIQFGAFVARKLAFLTLVLFQEEHEAQNLKTNNECLTSMTPVGALQDKTELSGAT